MKKLLFILICLFTANAFAGAFDLQQNKTFSKEQDKLAAELNNIQKNTCNLYGLVEKELSAYYGKQGIKDFYDPNHQTGWFRVYDFLSWLKANEKDLIEKLDREAYKYNYLVHKISLNKPLKKYCSLRTTETKGFLGSFLGREYLLSKYSAKILLKYAAFYIEPGEEPSAYHSPVKVRIPKGQNTLLDKFPEEINLAVYPTTVYEKNKNISFVNFVNSSVHESMHLLGIFTLQYNDAIPEMFTIYAQMAYGLPLKPEESFSGGVRNLYNTQKYFPQETFTEYNDALYTYIQFKKINEMKLKDIISFTKKVPSVGEVALPNGETAYDQAPDFFLFLFRDDKSGEKGYNLDEKLNEIKQDSSYQILYEDETVLVVKKESSVKMYATMKEYNYISEMIIKPIDIDEYVNKIAFIFPEYKQTFKNLAQTYINLEYNALYKEYNFEKYLDIEHNPLKYVLKENKDIPPVPKGYI